MSINTLVNENHNDGDISLFDCLSDLRQRDGQGFPTLPPLQRARLSGSFPQKFPEISILTRTLLICQKNPTKQSMTYQNFFHTQEFGVGQVLLLLCPQKTAETGLPSPKGSLLQLDHINSTVGAAVMTGTEGRGQVHL